MLTRKKRTGIDLSPKSMINKSMQLVPKHEEDMSVTPTRRNRFKIANNITNNIIDDSPVLSQENINVTWKWTNDCTPTRPSSKANRLHLHKPSATESPQAQIIHSRFLPKRSTIDDDTKPMTSSVQISEPESHSPKGLYKFQEEMRKIQLEADMSCDNIGDISKKEKSKTLEDTGYPIEIISPRPIEKPPPHHETEDMFNSSANDLFNDSDFDQMLLTCSEKAEKEVRNKQPENETNVKKKASSAPEITSSNPSTSCWSLVNDEPDEDWLKDVDLDISMNESSKSFLRHNSMPPQQRPQTSASKLISETTDQLGPNLNRKSFIRHESMPITVGRLRREENIRSEPYPCSSSGSSSSQSVKCTSEEIAEKRRQAIERLKRNRQMK